MTKAKSVAQRRKSKGRPGEGLSDDPALQAAFERAQAAYEAMTPAQKAEHDAAQRASWARANISTGDPRFD